VALLTWIIRAASRIIHPQGRHCPALAEQQGVSHLCLSAIADKRDVFQPIVANDWLKVTYSCKTNLHE